MSAIAGLWRLDGSGAEAGCRAMLDDQRLYGLDARNQWSGGDVGRALVRFLPEDGFDTQPLVGGGSHILSPSGSIPQNRIYFSSETTGLHEIGD